MREIERRIKETCKKLLAHGTVNRVLGWEAGLFEEEVSPAVFEADKIDLLVYNQYCGSNLSKYLIGESGKEGKILVLLKPCDTYSFNQLLMEHRIQREKVYVLGVPCGGMMDTKGMLLKCKTCKGREYKVFDELIESDLCPPEPEDRFALIRELQQKSTQERFDFWRGELSKCIRCNACRNVCPACTCRKCIFDNHNSGVDSKANRDEFEENLFHIIRAFHVAGRCTDCGECSRVCPQGIPLHLLNRKFIMEMNDLYGEYQAGEEVDARSPLVNFTKQDAEPSVVYERGGKD
ncbi:MAG: 4Fe-4S dicluster domain-containing protein [Lachnospiraceae bacterium]